MHNNPKVIAALLAGVLAAAITLSMRISANLSVYTLITLFIVVFVVALTGTYFTLEHVYFRRLRRLEKVLKKLKVQISGEVHEPEDLLDAVTARLATFIEEKQREIDRLEKQEAFRKNFVADVSHELKTPIFAAQGFIHTLIDGAAKEKALRRKFLKKAARSLDDLDMLVQDLLTLSNIETGQTKMRFREIDLYALTTDVFDQFRGKSNKKGVGLRIEGPVRKVAAFADWQRISQVMTNLVSNAINHSRDADEVIVSFDIRKNVVVTRVRDFGEGIQRADLPHIFERFYRADKSRSREKGGTGLGLAIVKHILEGHHAKAEVESLPGKGSTFSFKLPRFAPEMNDDGEKYETTS